MIRKKKRYVRPKKLYEKVRIEEENKLMEKYALKSKREIWKSIAKIDYFRRRAKALAKSPLEEQEVLFNKLGAIGLKAKSTADVLALNIDDLLSRRLPTIVHKRGIAKTVKQARQMVTHKKILINGRAVNSPSYLVRVAEENIIFARVKKEEKPQEAVTLEAVS